MAQLHLPRGLLSQGAEDWKLLHEDYHRNKNDRQTERLICSGKGGGVAVDEVGPERERHERVRRIEGRCHNKHDKLPVNFIPHP